MCLRADLADSGCTEVVAALVEMVVPAAASRYAVWLVKKRSAWRKKTAQNGRGFGRRYRPERRTFSGFFVAPPIYRVFVRVVFFYLCLFVSISFIWIIWINSI